MMGDMGYGFGGGWMGWLGPIIMVVFWAAVIAGIVFLIRWLILRSSPPEKKESALDILKRRYAAGGINGEEYEQMKKELF